MYLLIIHMPAIGPLESTVCEFWSLVWEQAVPAIVMLTKNFDLIRVMCVQYWPRYTHTQMMYIRGVMCVHVR